MTETATISTDIGRKILLIGGSGSGKTYSAALLAKQGVKVRFLFTENGMATLEGLPPDLTKLLGDGIDYQYCPGVTTDIATLMASAKLVNTLSYESLTQMPPTDRKKTQEYLSILSALMNYKSAITGKEYGPVTGWDSNTCLVLDSLSGLNLAVFRNGLGTKPVAGQNDWQVAMKAEEELINVLCLLAKCWVIVTAHPERETDEITGATFVYAGALGRKLGPKLGRYFDEIIEVKRKADKHTWSNASEKIDTKRRLLPYNQNIIPSWEYFFK